MFPHGYVSGIAKPWVRMRLVLVVSYLHHRSNHRSLDGKNSPSQPVGSLTRAAEITAAAFKLKLRLLNVGVCCVYLSAVFCGSYRFPQDIVPGYESSGIFTI